MFYLCLVFFFIFLFFFIFFLFFFRQKTAYWLRISDWISDVCSSDLLSMQELASRRIANASISAKRQVWIDELRKDVAKYLSIWQEISYRWDAVVNKPREGAISDEELAAFSQPIAQMRKEAHELQLLIELRLNMTEVNHQDLKALMNKLENTTLLYNRTVSQLPPKNIQTVFKVGLNEVVIKTQKILKEEWERVKKDSYADPNDHSHTK